MNITNLFGGDLDEFDSDPWGEYDDQDPEWPGNSNRVKPPLRVVDKSVELAKNVLKKNPKLFRERKSNDRR
jgi:hypothetical protein